MQTTFPEALRLVLRHEGGYVDNPKDPGGATMHGITLETYQRYAGIRKTKQELQAITPEEVAAIYESRYWTPCACRVLPSGVDYVVFDQAVNSGTHQSARWLQRAVGANIDGVIGHLTIQAACQEDPVVLIEAMCRIRLSFLERIRNGTLWQTFGRGWRRRVEDVRAAGIRLAGGRV